ncbi:MAG: putative DCC family thiol-disulfide oxidoreductase YuxK [Thalassolituus sp.]
MQQLKPESEMTELTLYYDGQCPLCVAEVTQLMKRDKDQKMRMVDIQEPGFTERYPHIDPQAASDILHAEYPDGRIILGLDVAHQAWGLVGKGYLYAPLRWPVIRWFADKAYLWFARNRYKVSGWLTGKERCDTCGPKGCSIDDASSNDK